MEVHDLENFGRTHFHILMSQYLSLRTRPVPLHAVVKSALKSPQAHQVLSTWLSKGERTLGKEARQTHL